MTKQEHLRFRKGDFLVIAAVVLMAVLVAVGFLPKGNDGPVMAEIYRQGERIKTLSLEEETSFTITGDYTNVVTVKDGGVAITFSDCPGEDCVHSGAIRAPGRSIVCLPNEVEVRIVNGEADVDFVVG